jgi:hypothetical protein
MNLSPPLQQEIEQIATLQGISPDQFILQTLMEKVKLIKNQSIDRSSSSISSLEVSHLQEKEGLLVFETESLNHIDFCHPRTIELSRGDRSDDIGKSIEDCYGICSDDPIILDD